MLAAICSGQNRDAIALWNWIDCQHEPENLWAEMHVYLPWFFGDVYCSMMTGLPEPDFVQEYMRRDLAVRIAQLPPAPRSFVSAFGKVAEYLEKVRGDDRP